MPEDPPVSVFPILFFVYRHITLPFLIIAADPIAIFGHQVVVLRVNQAEVPLCHLRGNKIEACSFWKKCCSGTCTNFWNSSYRDLTEIKAKTNIEESTSVIIPRKGISEIIKQIEGENIVMNGVISKNHLKITGEQTEAITKLVDGKFPDYEKVIPELNQQIKDILLDGMRKAGLK